MTFLPTSWILFWLEVHQVNDSTITLHQIQLNQTIWIRSVDSGVAHSAGTPPAACCDFSQRKHSWKLQLQTIKKKKLAGLGLKLTQDQSETLPRWIQNKQQGEVQNKPKWGWAAGEAQTELMGRDKTEQHRADGADGGTSSSVMLLSWYKTEHKETKKDPVRWFSLGCSRVFMDTVTSWLVWISSPQFHLVLFCFVSICFCCRVESDSDRVLAAVRHWFWSVAFWADSSTHLWVSPCAHRFTDDFLVLLVRCSLIDLSLIHTFCIFHGYTFLLCPPPSPPPRLTCRCVAPHAAVGPLTDTNRAEEEENSAEEAKMEYDRVKEKTDSKWDREREKTYFGSID